MIATNTHIGLPSHSLLPLLEYRAIHHDQYDEDSENDAPGDDPKPAEGRRSLMTATLTATWADVGVVRRSSRGLAD